MPPTMCLPRKAKTSSSGTVDIRAPVSTTAWSTVWLPAPRPASATWRVGLPSGVRAMKGQKKSFHAWTKTSMPSTAMVSLATGKTTCQMMRRLWAPSIRAASTSSIGSASSRNWRMKKTPKAATSEGSTTDWSWSNQPRSVMIRYSGMTLSCGGIVMVATTRESIMPRPRKGSLAKANPASVENRTVDSATRLATIVVLISASPMSTWFQAKLRLSMRREPGSSGAGASTTRSPECEAATTFQYSGKSETNAATTSRA